MKTLRTKNNVNIISVNDNYSNLLLIDKNIFEYEFFLDVNLIEMLKRDYFSIKLSIFNDNPVFLDKNDILDPEQFINKVLLSSSENKSLKDRNAGLVMNSVYLDPTSKINNQVIKSNKVFDLSKVNKKIEIVSKSNSDMNVSNVLVPILQHSLFSKTSKISENLFIKSLLNDSKDLTSDIENQFIEKPEHIVSGVRNARPSNNRVYSSIISSNNLRNSGEVVDDRNLPIVSHDNINISTLRKVIKIDNNLLKRKNYFFISFDLLNKNGSVVQKIVKKVPHSKNIKNYQQPIGHFLATIYNKKPGVNILKIKKNNINATKVRIYRKILKSTSVVENTKYNLVGDFVLTEPETTISDNIGNDSTIIYRLIAIGAQGQIASDFINIVSSGLKTENCYRENLIMSSNIIGTIINNGIQLQCISIPSDVISVMVLKRDLTLFETSYSVVPHLSTNSQVFLTNGSTKTGIFLDKNVKVGHVYEYTSKLLFKNGAERISNGKEVIEYVSNIFDQDSVALKVSQPKIVLKNNNFDVVFTINASIEDSSIDYIKQSLKKNGLLDYYSSELTNEKDSFKKIVAFFVKRIDLTTGENFFFRVFTKNVFSDFENQDENNIKFLESGHSYKYIIYPLLRSPETMFSDNIKTITNKIDKEFNYLPSKFFHPLVSKTGNAITNSSLKLNYPRDPLEFGVIGRSYEVDISLNNSDVKLSNAKAIKLNDNKVSIKWEIIGEKEKIEHFIIICNKIGQEEVIGKAHAMVDGNIIEFFDLFNKKSGTIKYKIIPVLNNYNYGSAIFTNEIVI